LVPSARAQVAPLTDLHQNRHVIAVPAKDVPFGDLDDDQSRLGVQTPKKEILWASIGISSQICKKFKSPYLQNYAADLHKI